jgi:hypothetical protein
MRIEDLPEVIEIGERPLPPSLPFNGLDNPHQAAGIILFKPVDSDDVVFQGSPLVSQFNITEEVTGRLQERKKMGTL